MKVKELIEELKKLTNELEQLNPDDEISIETEWGEYWILWFNQPELDGDWWVIECPIKC